MRIIDTTNEPKAMTTDESPSPSFPTPAENQTHWHIKGLGYFKLDGAFVGPAPPQLTDEHPECSINGCGWCFSLVEIARQDHARGTCMINENCPKGDFDERNHYCPLHRCAAVGHTPSQGTRDKFCVLCCTKLEAPPELMPPDTLASDTLKKERSVDMERFTVTYDAQREAITPSLFDFVINKLRFRTVPAADTRTLKVRWPTNQQERYLAGGWSIVDGKFHNGMPCVVDDTMPASEIVIEDDESIATIRNVEVL